MLSETTSSPPGFNPIRFPSVEFLKFVLFGAINSALTFVIYLVLLRGLDYPLAYTASYVAGIFIGYYINARFVFREPLRLIKAVQFPAVYLVQYLVGMLLLHFLIDRFGMNRSVAPLLVVIVTVPMTFLLSRFIIRRALRSG